MERILISTKKLLGIDEEYDHFDPDIIMHINSAFSTLNQLGVGPETCFRIEDEDSVWEEFIADNTDIEMVKTYVAAKVRLAFDPPDRTVVMEALKSTIEELEFRLNVAAESKRTS